MARTSFVIRKKEMKHEPLPQCHGGVGTLDFTEILTRKGSGSGNINFMHNTILPPGTSVGVHRHANDEEYYYLISGTGVMILDGERHPVSAGDITAVFPGGSHGMENTGSENISLVVLSVSQEAK